MHLINCHSLQLEEFNSEYSVEYVILSHRWQEDEPNYQDCQNLATCNKKGVGKVTTACQLALSSNYSYIWIDTVCIDKTSSSALSEAINSMFRWYQMAQVCYAFLADVDIVQYGQAPPSFDVSSWFTRSWTLQELLAPREVIFLDAKWQVFGSRSSLFERISLITGVDAGALVGDSLDQYSIAEKMSWASKRTATRVEDMAYSLMGLFDVNMPMLYGEGHKAFYRLQEELLRHSSDQSLFAWQLSTRESSRITGLLAPNPFAFVHCRNIKASTVGDTASSYSLTNKGLSIDLGLKEVADGIYKAFLQAKHVRGHDLDHFIGIYLAKLRGPGDQYVRTFFQGQHIWTCAWYELPMEFFTKSIVHVKQQQFISSTGKRPQVYEVSISPMSFNVNDEKRSYVPIYGKDVMVNWGPRAITSTKGVDTILSKKVLLNLGRTTPICTVDLARKHCLVDLIHFGFDEQLCPCFLVIDETCSENIRFRQVQEHSIEMNEQQLSEAALFDRLPNLNTIKSSTIEHYSPSLHWCSQAYTGLKAQVPHCGLWAIIGNERQNLRFKIDSGYIESWPKNQRAKRNRSNGRRLDREYLLEVSLVLENRGLEYYWDLTISYEEYDKN